MWIFGALMIAMPLLAVALVTRFVVAVATPQSLSLGAAIVVGIVVGSFAVIAFTAISGTDATDLIVSSLWIILFALMMQPVVTRAKARRLKRKNAPAQMQKKAPIKSNEIRVSAIHYHDAISHTASTRSVCYAFDEAEKIKRGEFMAKTLSFEFPESEVAELEKILMQMQIANQQMQRDQEEINRLKMETRAIADQTRRVLQQLEAAS